MQKSKNDRNSRPSSASRLGSTSTRQNMPGSAENIKALYDRGRPSVASSSAVASPVGVPSSKSGKTPIKPKQTTTSMQRQKVNICSCHLSLVRECLRDSKKNRTTKKREIPGGKRSSVLKFIILQVNCYKILF